MFGVAEAPIIATDFGLNIDSSFAVVSHLSFMKAFIPNTSLTIKTLTMYSISLKSIIVAEWRIFFDNLPFFPHNSGRN